MLTCIAVAGRNGGLDTEKDYKYKAQDGVCNIAKEKRHVVTIDSYEDVPPNDESALKKVCAPSPWSARWYPWLIYALHGL